MLLSAAEEHVAKAAESVLGGPIVEAWPVMAGDEDRTAPAILPRCDDSSSIYRESTIKSKARKGCRMITARPA